jgi:hypothetical protein
MSWKAQRHSKRKVSLREPSFSGRGHRGPLVKHRFNDQQIIARLPKTDELFNVFGLRSPEQAFRVALRIKRAKQRTVDTISLVHADSHVSCRRRLTGRNNHHLTPKSRKDQPYFGDTPHNLLLIKVDRHDALHRVFESRTWEEIIFLLARCIKGVRTALLQNIIERAVPSGRKKKNRCNTRYHSHSRCRSFSRSPG